MWILKSFWLLCISVFWPVTWDLIYLLGLLWEFKEIIHAMRRTQCLLYSKCSVKVNYDYAMRKVPSAVPVAQWVFLGGWCLVLLTWPGPSRAQFLLEQNLGPGCSPEFPSWCFSGTTPWPPQATAASALDSPYSRVILPMLLKPEEHPCAFP